MTEPPPTTANEAPALVRLSRDVGVNVLANLIAAAIIYLLGVAVGLLPSTRAAIVVAILLLTIVGTVWLIVSSGRADQRLPSSLVFLGVGAVIGAVLGVLDAPLIWTVGVLFGDLVLYWVIILLRARRRVVRARRNGSISERSS